MVNRISDEEYTLLLKNANSKGYRKIYNDYRSLADILEFCVEQRTQSISGLYMMIERLEDGVASEQRRMKIKVCMARLLFLNELEFYILTHHLQKEDEEQIHIINTKYIKNFLKEIGWK